MFHFYLHHDHLLRLPSDRRTISVYGRRGNNACAQGEIVLISLVMESGLAPTKAYLPQSTGKGERRQTLRVEAEPYHASRELDDG